MAFTFNLYRYTTAWFGSAVNILAKLKAVGAF
jgi:hypothetical protein